MTYEPSVTVIAQRRKHVELARKVFIYDASRFPPASVDLPVVSRVIEASEEAPCVALSLKFGMPVVRELLSREEIQGARPAVPAWRPVRPLRHFPVFAAGWLTCSTRRRTFLFSAA